MCRHHTTLETRERFARLCVQVNFDKPIVKIVKVGGIHQPVQYEGNSSLCFSYGRVGHKEKGCPYSVKQLTKIATPENGVEKLACQKPVEDVDPEINAFGPWVLVARKGKTSRKMAKDVSLVAIFGSPFQSLIKPTNPLSPQLGSFTANGSQFLGIQNLSKNIGSSVMGADRTITYSDKTKSKTKTAKGKGFVHSQNSKKTS